MRKHILNWQKFLNRVAGYSYDQGATLKALNFYEATNSVFKSPPKSKHETVEFYK